MGTPLHEWQEKTMRSRLVNLVEQKPSQNLVSPVKVNAEVFFQPFSDKPVVALLWGEDGNLYRHNMNVSGWNNPFSGKSEIQLMYSRAEVELILDHSKIQYEHDSKEIEAKGYQTRREKAPKNVTSLVDRRKTLEYKLTG